MKLNEHLTLDRRRREFAVFLEEMEPVLSDFAGRLGLPNPNTATTEPEKFLEPVDAFMKEQIISDEDRIWILARVAYLIGQVLNQRLEGTWLLNENPNSLFFLRYVVGRFKRVRNPQATVDPFDVSTAFLSQPPGRSLAGIISEVEQECLRHQ